jgi:hypothetical protein
MLAEALTVAMSIEERRLLIDAARGRRWLTHTDLGPYAEQISERSGLSLPAPAAQSDQKKPDRISERLPRE